MEPKQTTLFDSPPKMKTVAGSSEASNEAKYYLVLIPDMGQMNAIECADYPSLCQELYNYQEQKAANKYTGDIFAFHGRVIRYSELRPVMQISHPDEGTIEVKDNSKFDFDTNDFVVSDN